MSDEADLNHTVETEHFSEANLKVDFLRHGQAKYSTAEYESGELSGELTEQGVETIRNSARELAAKINGNELVVIWSSPKNRADQSATILGETLSSLGTNVYKKPENIKRENLRDVKATKPGADLLWQEFFKSPFANELDRWMEFYTTNQLPEGVETPVEISKRVMQILTVLEKLSHFSKLPNSKKLHLVIITHEEFLRDLLETAFGFGTTAETRAKNGEILNVDINSSMPRSKAEISISFRGREAELMFDEINQQLTKKSD